MHAVGLHSALAIKRQRKRRDEQRRARERRYSSQSGESGLTSPRASTASLDQNFRRKRNVHVRNFAKPGMVDSKVVTSIGMLHVGVVFLVLGIFLLISGILPNDFANIKSKEMGKWWNELVAIGLFAIVIGCFLIILNRVVAKKEEDDLEEYVQRQLTRSKSGHRLERDAETGGLTTTHAKRSKQLQNMGLCSCIDEDSKETKAKSPPKSVNSTPFSHSIESNQSTLQSSLLLEQITEEETVQDKLNASTFNSIPNSNNHY